MVFSRLKIGKVGFGLLALLFFLSTLFLSVGITDMYNSPDERANAVSIQSYIDDGDFTVLEPLNLEVAGVLGPRSMVAVDDKLAPIGFAGLPSWYGLIGKVFGFPFVLLITPLLALLAVFAWKGILESVFNKRVAILGAVLMLFLAGFWFYSARTLMHNVPFLAFFIFGIYFLIRRPFTRRKKSKRILWIDVALSGIFLGTAILFRGSEIIWMTLVGLIFYAFYPRVLGWRNTLVFIVALGLAITPMFAWNMALFGDPLQFGYTVTEAGSSSLTLLEQVTPRESPSTLASVVFPFGFHPRLAWRNFVDYQLELTWWMTLLAFAGLPFLFAPRKQNGKRKRALHALVASTFVAGLYLSLMYGSWPIVDNPDPSARTLANSYVRYWLPIYFMSTVPAALFLEWFMNRAKTLTAQRLLGLAVLIPVAVLSMNLVFFQAEDGLVKTRSNLLESVAIRDRVSIITEENSVVIVDRADKILFPERRVVTPLRDSSTFGAIPVLMEKAPLYYYGITLPEQDFGHLNNEILAPLGVRIGRVETIGIETLYRFTKL